MMFVIIDVVLSLLLHGVVCYLVDKLCMEITPFVKSIWGIDFLYYKYDKSPPDRFYNCNTISIFITSLFLLVQPLLIIFIQAMFFMYIDTARLTQLTVSIYLIRLLYNTQFDQKPSKVLMAKFLMVLAIPSRCVYMALVDVIDSNYEDIPIRVHSVVLRLTNSDVSDKISDIIVQIKTRAKQIFYIRFGLKVLLLLYVLLLDKHLNVLDVYYLVFIIANQYVEGFYEKVQ